MKISSFPERKNKEVKDPPRFPKVIDGYEKVARRNYHNMLQETVGDVYEIMKKHIE